jgi:GR25 family glycosyltransferase involved in LPS biosynthesis
MARSFTVKARSNRSLSTEQKLNNFPIIHFIGINDRLDRVSGFISMLKDFKISKVIPHIFKKYRHGDCDVRFFSPHYDRGYPQGHFGCFTSHLKVLYEWYNNTDEPYIFVCEDDLSFETIEYWNFTWEEFFERLPENWDIVQLCLLRNIGTMFNFFQPDVHLRNRCWCDWSSAAYLISRKHVKNLLDTYYNGKSFIYEYRGYDKDMRHDEFAAPSVETIICTNFSSETKIYTFPLFVEDLERGYNSTHWEIDFRDYSRNEILNWWKNTGKTMKLEKIFGYL